MGDHFVLFMDRLITEYTIDSVIESTKQLQPSANEDEDEDEDEKMINFSSHIDIPSSPRKMVECRICHDEDEDYNMEIPCSCCGSLKFAHRRCVQRWCNEKGNTLCEICKQQFEPGYTASPPLFHMRNREVLRRESHNSRLIAMMDRGTSNRDFDDYSGPSTRNLVCCRIIVVILMVLLVLRHTLPVMITGAGDYTMTLFMLLMLRTIGILLPICIMVKAFRLIQRRQHHRVLRNMSFSSSSSSDEDSELPPVLESQQHIFTLAS